MVADGFLEEGVMGFAINCFAADLKHLKIRYAWRGVYFNWNNSTAQNLSHVQMLKCANGIVSISPNSTSVAPLTGKSLSAAWMSPPTGPAATAR